MIAASMVDLALDAVIVFKRAILSIYKGLMHNKYIYFMQPRVSAISNHRFTIIIEYVYIMRYNYIHLKFSFELKLFFW